MKNKPSRSKSGLVIWITGLSGAGKSTVANLVVRELQKTAGPTVLVDGDAVREICGDELGFHREDRLKNAYRITRLCRFLASQGITVVCATMSLFKEIHDFNRKQLPGYFEVYLRVPMSELHKRDPKGFYQKANSGKIQHVAGMDMQYDVPEEAHLVVDNHSSVTPEQTAQQIVAKVMSHSQHEA